MTVAAGPLVQSLIDSLGERARVPFAVITPDGAVYHTGRGEPVFRVLFHTDAALLSTFMRGHIGLLDAYFDQAVDVEGDLGAAMRGRHGQRIRHAVQRGQRPREQPARMAPLECRSIAQARTNARAHYGLGADFYRLWLDDPLLMYTCGYWPEGTQHARGGAAPEDRPRLPQAAPRGR